MARRELTLVGRHEHPARVSRVGDFTQHTLDPDDIRESTGAI